jgi:hypothetical protein
VRGVVYTASREFCYRIPKSQCFYNNLPFGFAVACPLYFRMSSEENPSILSCSRIAFRYQRKLRHSNIDSQNAPRCKVYSCLHTFNSFTCLLREGWHGVQNLREASDPMHDVSMTVCVRYTIARRLHFVC